MQNELIIVSEYCDKCHIEPSFIEMLQEIGLIDIRGAFPRIRAEIPERQHFKRDSDRVREGEEA